MATSTRAVEPRPRLHQSQGHSGVTLIEQNPALSFKHSNAVQSIPARNAQAFIFFLLNVLVGMQVTQKDKELSFIILWLKTTNTCHYVYYNPHQWTFKHLCVSLQMGGNPFGAPIDAMAAFGFAGPNMNPQVKGFLS